MGLFRILAAGLILGLFVLPASGQKKTTAPEITFAHKGADKALGDLEKILMLTNERQRKQWKVIKDNLEVFLLGIDRSRPLRIDLLMRSDGKINYRPAFPIANLQMFLKENLQPFGIKTRRVSSSLYKCKGNVFEGYMRYKHKYAVFAAQRTDLPQNMPNPTEGVKKLLAVYDLALQGVNRKVDAASVKRRRASFARQRKELLALLKKKEKESEADFELRRTFLQQQLNELERFYAETARLVIGWKMDTEKMEGEADLDLSAIPGTSLAQSVELLGQQPSYFARVPSVDKSILSLRVNWPVDDMRQNHFLDMFKKVRDREVARYQADTTLTDKQKEANTQLADSLVKLLSDNVQNRYFDLFVEVHSNANGKNTAVGGFRTTDGNRMIEILKLLPDTGKGRSVQLDVDKEGKVRIHQADFQLSEDSLLKSFLGGGVVYVGTSKDAVWFAAGPGSLEELKAAIKARTAAGETASRPDNVFFDLSMRLGPWIELLNRVDLSPLAKKETDKKPTDKKPDETTTAKTDGKTVVKTAAAGSKKEKLKLSTTDLNEIRQLAKEAFQGGKDTITARLQRDGDKVTGKMHIQTDVLRFVGALVAKFSEETLDDSSGQPKKTIQLKR